mgnify:CR=1 FL=1
MRQLTPPCRLYRPGSVGFVSKSGGMSNELYNVIARAADGIYEGGFDEAEAWAVRATVCAVQVAAIEVAQGWGTAHGDAAAAHAC